MANQPAGVSQQGGNWMWSCTCGASGTPKANREQVREEYKEHRKTCGALAQSEGTPTMSTTAKDPTAPRPPKSAKKPAAAKKDGGRKKREQSVSEADAKSALARLKDGKSTLIAESKKIGFTHNGPLRAALRQLIGRDAYDKLMATSKKAPPKKAAGNGKKAGTKKADAPASVPAASETSAPADGGARA